ncbi:uncharacterized protein IL334_005741 [Kwoniella shivajii]|uniref:Uncharacterized protein n=1 Tax=Kwoniella shivajii TaxID=564305 RepID=A0ABZ1D4J7_9TREE|nr:hypothetical protein IL334_005741 [Kwoniella shivajii]
MQCSSSIRTYVFRSIILPFLSPGQLTASTSAVHRRGRCSAASISHTARCSHTSTTGCPPIPREVDGGQKSTQRRSVSTYQPIRGHDPPPSIESQRRAKAYLGLTVQGRKEKTRLPGHAETSAMALQSIMQAYGLGKLGSQRRTGITRKEYDQARQREHDGPSQDMTLTTSSIKHTASTQISSNTPIPKPTEQSTLEKEQSSHTVPPFTKSQQDDTPLTSFSSSQPAAISQGSTAKIRIKATPSTQIPPVIQRLLSGRLFRLAVFHLLSTPEYAINGELLSSIADTLERGGAGKLAKRLRRGWEVFSANTDRTDLKDGKNKEFKRMRLFSDARSVKEDRLPANHWNLPLIPPSKPSDTVNRQNALTNYYNAHLQYLLTRPYLSQSSHIPITEQPRVNAWPAPSPNLSQLRRLLSTVKTLERTRGFRPDRKTANLVLRCWLRSAAPSASRDGNENSLREYRDKEGNTRSTRKMLSEKGLNVKELRMLFDILSKIISSNRLKTHTDISNVEKEAIDSDEKEKEWEDIILPFGKPIIRAMKGLGDKRGVEMVRQWMEKEQLALLGAELH